MAIQITTTTAKNIIKSIANGEMFSIGYFRKEPVCNGCGCKKGVRGVCPECGSTDINYICETNAQRAVSNPKNATKPGQGAFKGQSAEEAERKNNNLKYYNCNGSDEKGRGVYRSCGYDRIYKIITNGIEYEVIDAVSTL